MAKKSKPKKTEVPKTIKVGNERFRLISRGLSESDAKKKADWHRYKGKKVRTKKYGDKYYNFAKMRS